MSIQQQGSEGGLVVKFAGSGLSVRLGVHRACRGSRTPLTTPLPDT